MPIQKYVPPKRSLDAFHCAHCGVYAHQYWCEMIRRHPNIREGNFGPIDNDNSFGFNICEHCGCYSIWIKEKMCYPSDSTAALPSEDIPSDVKEDYMEARAVVNSSPRAACALLRLSIQKLMPHLGENSTELNKDIGNLVKKGLPITIQQALDCVRVIGNNAVHPGELDLKDNLNTANALFGLVNLVVNSMITQPKEVQALYDSIPTGAKEAITKRDSKA